MDDSAMDNSADEARRRMIVAGTVTLLVVTWITVSLRYYVRARLAGGCDSSDYLMLAALLGFTTLAGFTLTSIQYGFGLKRQYVTTEQHLAAAKYIVISTVVWAADMLLVKLSMAVLLLKIAVQRRYTWIVKVSMSFISVWTAAYVFFSLFRCRPFQALWDITYVGGYCIKPLYIPRVNYGFSVLYIFSDFLYALLPIPMLLTIRMNLEAKIAVLIILGLGVFASFATIMRIIAVGKMLGPDGQIVLYNCTDSIIWLVLEPGISIIAASLITLRPLLRSWGITRFNSTMPPPPQLNVHRSSTSKQGIDPKTAPPEKAPAEKSTSGKLINALAASLIPDEDEIVNNME